MPAMIDVAAARETFEASEDLTVGHRGGVRAPRSRDARARAAVRAAARRRGGERSGARGVDLGRADLLRDRDPLRPRRRHRSTRTRASATAPAAVRARRRHGVALGSTGTHPLSDYREQHIIDTEHYHRVEDGLKYVAWRNNTFSLHVHVGDQGRRPGGRGVRPAAPRAAAAAGDLRQLAVRRRARLRPAHGAHPDLHEVVPALRRARRVRLLGGVGRLRRPARAHRLDRRVHAAVVVGPPAPRFGTVEVRVCDARTPARSPTRSPS